MVDSSSLSYVLKVDMERKPATVEPNVPMDRLVEETLKYGLVPPVVSFEHEFFDCALNSVEMVLANDDIVTCSEKESLTCFTGQWVHAELWA